MMPLIRADRWVPGEWVADYRSPIRDDTRILWDTILIARGATLAIVQLFSGAMIFLPSLAATD